MTSHVRALLLGLAAGFWMAAGPGQAIAEDKLRVKVFPGPQNLALYAANENGFFAKRGLSVEVQFTTGSGEQRDGLVAGAFEIAQAGVDNAVALADANKDVVIVSGGSNGMNEFIVRPEIKSYADIKGTKVVVDAPNTAYALIAYKVLQMQGISRDQYGLTPAGGCPQRLAAMREDKANASAMLNLPCNLIAMKDGYKSMGTAVDLIGPYQADGTWVMRSWAQAHPDLLVKFLQGCIEGYRWAATPSNKAAAAALIVKVLKVEPDIAMGSVDITVGPKQGLAKDLAFDRNGFINTLKLRAEMIGGDANPNPDKYVDLSYLQKALAGL